MHKHRPQIRIHRHGAAAIWIIGSLMALAVVSVAAVSLIRKNSSGDMMSEHQNYTVQQASFDLVIPASGELEALSSIEIRNKVQTRSTIKWIIDEGVIVKKGDVLVELASDQIEDRIQQEQLSVSSAEAAVRSAEQALEIQKNENQSAEQKARTAVEIAQLELDRWKEGESQTRLTELELSLEKAERNLDRFKREYADSKELFEQGFISQSELEQDEIELLEGEASLKNAKLALEVYKDYTYPKDLKQRTSDLEEAQAELSRTLARNASQIEQKETDLKSKQEQLGIRRRGLERLQEQFDACTVEAPADGLVVYGTSVGGRWWRGNDESLEIGQEVHDNQLLIILPDTSRLVASVKVHESQFSQIDEGMQARVRVDALKDKSLDGEVQSVGVMAEQSFGSQVREYTVEILIKELNQWGLKPSMRCKADIFLGHVDNAIAVPIESVFVEKGQHFVWVREGDRYRRTQVQIGRASETMIEILKGLNSGDIVLLREPEPGERA